MTPVNPEQPRHVESGPSGTRSPDLAAVQRRTLGTLVITQALGGVGVSSALTIAPLLARDVTGSDSLAGLVQTAQVLGAAVIVIVLAAYMARRGRRPGLTLGYLVGALGSGVCVLAGVLGSFPVLLLGAVLIGAPSAANSQARYAGTDLASPRRRGRDLSTIVWATTVGAVVGPNLAGPGGAVAGWLGLPVRTGPFLFSGAALLVTAAVMVSFLRPDPLLLARSRDIQTPVAEAAADPVAVAVAAGPSAWSLIRTRPLVRAAAVGMALTHAVMISVMVMTPIHMSHGSASLEIIGLVISGHILGMYAFSPLVGVAVDRLGSAPVLAAGGVVMLLALLLSGRSPAGSSGGLGAGLFLLGLGWSLGTVAASTLLTSSTPLPQRAQVQGLADMTTGFTAAAGGAVSGVVLGTVGFGWLNAGAGVLAVAMVVVAIVAARHTAGGR